MPDVVLYDPDQIGGAEGVVGVTPVPLALPGGLAHDPVRVAAVLEAIVQVAC